MIKLSSHDKAFKFAISTSTIAEKELILITKFLWQKTQIDVMTELGVSDEEAMVQLTKKKQEAYRDLLNDGKSFL